MQHAERLIAGDLIGHDNAIAEHVRQLLQRNRLVLHFAPNRKRPLLPPMHMGFDAVLAQQRGKLIGDGFQHIAAILLQFVEPLDNQVAPLFIDFGKGEVFQLVAEVLHADATGQRRINIQRFLRDAFALFVGGNEMQRAHIVQPVGQLDQKNAHITGRGQKQLTEVFGLRHIGGRQFEQ